MKGLDRENLKFFKNNKNQWKKIIIFPILYYYRPSTETQAIIKISKVRTKANVRNKLRRRFLESLRINKTTGLFFCFLIDFASNSWERINNSVKEFTLKYN